MQIPGGAKPQGRLRALLGLSAVICLAAGGALLSFLTGTFDPQPQPGAASLVEAVHNHQYCQAIAGGAGNSACIPRAEIVVKLSRGASGWILFAAAAGLLGLLALREGRSLTHVLAVRAAHRPRHVGELVRS